MTVPKSHPRYDSLKKREKIIQGMKDGIVAEAGPIAHGRGEAFDYLLGEKTHPEAYLAEKIAAYHLILAKHPVISVNGNVAALVPAEVVELANVTNAKIEANLFHGSAKREAAIAKWLRRHGAKEVLGTERKFSTRIKELHSDRRKIDRVRLLLSQLTPETRALVATGNLLRLIED